MLPIPPRSLRFDYPHLCFSSSVLAHLCFSHLCFSSSANDKLSAEPSVAPQGLSRSQWWAETRHCECSECDAKPHSAPLDSTKGDWLGAGRRCRPTGRRSARRSRTSATPPLQRTAPPPAEPAQSPFRPRPGLNCRLETAPGLSPLLHDPSSLRQLLTSKTAPTLSAPFWHARGAPAGLGHSMRIKYMQRNRSISAWTPNGVG